MSTTETTQKTLTGEPSADQTEINLNEIVAQTVPIDGELPDFEEFRAVCAFTKETIEHAVPEDS